MAQPSTDWTVLNMLKWATGYFEDKGIRNPRLSIEWLLAHVLQKKRLDLYLIYDKPLTTKELNAIRPLVKRRATHEPLQYITGETDFFGCTISVKPGVLIPRPETEELVEWVLDKTKDANVLTVLDIGTGSGCIPIALKKARPNWSLIAFDISAEAIEIATLNAEINKTDVHFTVDNVFTPTKDLLSANYDVIVSNPPYILDAESDSLDQEVKKFEPSLALFTSSTEKMYRALEQFASKTLPVNGILALEINERFGQETLRLFEAPSWVAKIQQDYAGKDRFIFAKKVK